MVRICCWWRAVVG